MTKKRIFAILALLVAAALWAEKGSWKTGAYSLSVYYNKNAQPGDAIFVRLVLEAADDAARAQPCTGKIQLYEGTRTARAAKDIAHTDFYKIPGAPGARGTVLLAGIPLSSYLKTGAYTMFVTFKPFGGQESEFTLPITINPKEFVKETIQLDARNTAIKTNDSDERWRQIKKLNGILETRDFSGVYGTDAFLPPTNATRRTSFFADRRIYAYTDGNSSTSLHYGIDYGVPTGSEVRACGRGKVVMAEFRISTGWSTVIEHLPGLYSLYYHQSELKCAVGDIVERGDLIGLSGATGLATGPHLHWEVRLNMEAVSPDFFINDFTFEQASRSR